MTDTRDPHGIVNFFVRYLVLHVIFLVGLPLSYAMDLALIYFFGFLGFFTFFQVLASLSRDFLDRAGSWKAIVIAVTVLIDVPILWWFGRLVAGIAGSGSDWWLVTTFLPFHFLAAFFAWAIRESFFAPDSHNAATPNAPVSTVEPAATENPGDPNVANTPMASTGVTEADTDTDTDTDKQ